MARVNESCPLQRVCGEFLAGFELVASFSPAAGGLVSAIDTFRITRKTGVFGENAEHGGVSVIPQRVFTILASALAILLVAFAVLMAFYSLFLGLGDGPSSRVLLWAAMTCLILAVIDLVVLVCALGLNASELNNRSDEN